MKRLHGWRPPIQLTVSPERLRAMLPPVGADLAALEAAKRRRAHKAARVAKGFITGSAPPPILAGSWVRALASDPATGLKAADIHKVREIRASINPATPGVPVAMLEGFPPQGTRIGHLVFDGYRFDALKLTDAPEGAA